MDEEKEYMTIQEAAEYLDLTVQSVFINVKLKKLKPVQLGRYWYFEKDEVMAYKTKKFSREDSRRHEGELVFNPAKNRYSVGQVADMFEVSTNRIYHCLRKQMLKVERIGGTWVILIDNLDAWKPVICELKALN